MKIVHTSTGKEHSINIMPVEEKDLKKIQKTRYFFDWKTQKNYEIYKLQINGTNDILGLISIKKIPKEWRIHIRLLSVSKENKRKKKQYDRITGNLIAFISKIAVRDYGELACVSLKPKTAIAQHYINKYNMNRTGMTLSIEVPEIIDFINFYDND